MAENQELAEQRVQSLTVSHRARVHTLKDQLAKAINEKIRMMKHGELKRANADFDRRINELRSSGNTGDIRTALIFFGTVLVTGP